MKTPAFQFYPGDFLSSPDVQMMTTQEIGAYCLLLFNAWIITDRPGYLPNNENKLQRLTKLSDKEWKKVREVVLEKFSVSECSNFLFNKRLIAEFDKQEIRRLRLAANGQKGGRPPKPEENQEDNKTKPTDNLQVYSEKPNDNQEQRLSSSSSISSTNNNNTGTAVPATHTEVEGVISGIPDKPKEPTFEEKYKYFIDLFNKTAKRNFKGDSKSKTNLAARLKDGYTSNDFVKAITNCLNDDFHKANPHHLTPEFITRPDKLEKFLNAKAPEPDFIDKGCGTVVKTEQEIWDMYGGKNPNFTQPEDWTKLPGYQKAS